MLSLLRALRKPYEIIFRFQSEFLQIYPKYFVDLKRARMKKKKGFPFSF